MTWNYPLNQQQLASVEPLEAREYIRNLQRLYDNANAAAERAGAMVANLRQGIKWVLDNHGPGLPPAAKKALEDLLA